VSVCLSVQDDPASGCAPNTLTSVDSLVDEILSSRLSHSDAASDSGDRSTQFVTQEEYLVWAVNHSALPSDFLRLLTQVRMSPVFYTGVSYHMVWTVSHPTLPSDFLRLLTQVRMSPVFYTGVSYDMVWAASHPALPLDFLRLFTEVRVSPVFYTGVSYYLIWAVSHSALTSDILHG